MRLLCALLLLLPSPLLLLAQIHPSITVSYNYDLANYPTAGFHILRSTIPGGYYSLIASSSQALSYVDSNVDLGLAYYYRVTAVVDGVESALSAEVTATVAPLMPVQIQAIAAGTTVTVKWVPSDPVPTRISRGTSASGPFVVLTTTAVGATSYVDSGLAYGTYYYRIEAIAGSVTSPATILKVTLAKPCRNRHCS